MRVSLGIALVTIALGLAGAAAAEERRFGVIGTGATGVDASVKITTRADPGSDWALDIRIVRLYARENLNAGFPEQQKMGAGPCKAGLPVETVGLGEQEHVLRPACSACPAIGPPASSRRLRRERRHSWSCE